jgi:hypothetical protein
VPAAELLVWRATLIAIVAQAFIVGPARAQTPDRHDATQPYQGLALDSIPSSATVQDLGDGTKLYEFTNADGSVTRCATHDLAGGLSLMSCEAPEQQR